MRHLLAVQLTLATVVAGGLAVGQDLATAMAVLYGGLAAAANTLIQRWHMQRAERVAGRDPGRNLRVLVRCEIERLVSTVALLAVGLGVLKLAGLPLISGFILVTMTQFLDLFDHSEHI